MREKMDKFTEHNALLNSFFDKHYREYTSVHKKSFYHDEVTFSRHLRIWLGKLQMPISHLKKLKSGY